MRHCGTCLFDFVSCCAITMLLYSAFRFYLIKLESTTNFCLHCILLSFFKWNFHDLKCFWETFSVNYWENSILKHILLQCPNVPGGDCVPGYLLPLHIQPVNIAASNFTFWLCCGNCSKWLVDTFCLGRIYIWESISF